MKAKARVFMFDLECGKCGELIPSPEGNGSLMWNVHEANPSFVCCQECGTENKVPDRIPGVKIEVAS